jgi:ATP-dependent RNA helicase DeaD
MDQIVKADVDEEQIAPFMQDIDRYFEYVDKEDLIKKIVSMEFGKFLAYYADAPEISEVRSKKEEGRSKREEGRGRKAEKRGNGPRQAEAGYRRLFINLGKKDGFYPGELMQFLNKNVRGHIEVGHIDLLTTQSYFEVPEEDAEKVMKYVNGQRYKGREVRCNDADEGNDRKSRSSRDSRQSRPSREPRTPKEHKKTFKKEEWMQFLNPNSMKLKGNVPDFSEEGWAIRKPRKKK